MTNERNERKSLRDRNTGETVCPKCGRRYLWDLCLAKLRETITSERKSRGPCSYCQRAAEESVKE